MSNRSQLMYLHVNNLKPNLNKQVTKTGLQFLASIKPLELESGIETIRVSTKRENGHYAPAKNGANAFTELSET